MGESKSEIQNQIIQEQTIDTVNGNSKFSLIYGDMLQVHTDLWVTTVYAENKGELFQSIQKSLLLSEDTQERKIIPLRNGGHIGFINHSSQKLLTVNLNMTEGNPINQRDFNQMIQATFAGLAALVYEGYRFDVISIPVIGKKGIHLKEYEDSLKSLIHYAVNYLKYATPSTTINYYVLEKEELPFWDNAMSNIFSRNVLDPPNLNVFYRNISSKILETIDGFPVVQRTNVARLLDEIKWELENYPIPNYSLMMVKTDQLVDIIFKDLYKIDGIKVPRTNLSYRVTYKEINDLQKMEPIPNWIFTYLVSVRNLKDTNYFQSTTNSRSHSDESILFLRMLLKILSFFRDFCHHFYSRT